MSHWTEILDTGRDPGRYTLVRGDGLVVVANQNGSVVSSRKSTNPTGVVTALCRTPGICIVKPHLQADVRKKIYSHLTEEADDD